MDSDPTGNLVRMFGICDDSSGRALRGTFIINPEGILMNSEVNFYNMGRNIDELMRKFKANLYLAKKKDEGDKTLKPSPDMVGRVHEALNE